MIDLEDDLPDPIETAKAIVRKAGYNSFIKYAVKEIRWTYDPSVELPTAKYDMLSQDQGTVLEAMELRGNVTCREDLQDFVPGRKLIHALYALHPERIKTLESSASKTANSIAVAKECDSPLDYALKHIDWTFKEDGKTLVTSCAQKDPDAVRFLHALEMTKKVSVSSRYPGQYVAGWELFYAAQEKVALEKDAQAVSDVKKAREIVQKSESQEDRTLVDYAVNHAKWHPDPEHEGHFIALHAIQDPRTIIVLNALEHTHEVLPIKKGFYPNQKDYSAGDRISDIIRQKLQLRNMAEGQTKDGPKNSR